MMTTWHAECWSDSVVIKPGITKYLIQINFPYIFALFLYEFLNILAESLKFRDFHTISTILRHIKFGTIVLLSFTRVSSGFNTEVFSFYLENSMVQDKLR